MKQFMHGLFAGIFGAWLSGMMLLVTNHPWASVFVVGVCLGLYMMENWDLNDELDKMQNEICQHEKHIVGMQYTINKLTEKVGEMRVEYTRDKFRSIVHDRNHHHPLIMSSPSL
jgi:hypothetical protein